MIKNILLQLPHCSCKESKDSATAPGYLHEYVICTVWHLQKIIIIVFYLCEIILSEAKDRPTLFDCTWSIYLANNIRHKYSKINKHISGVVYFYNFLLLGHGKHQGPIIWLCLWRIHIVCLMICILLWYKVLFYRSIIAFTHHLTDLKTQVYIQLQHWMLI